MLKFHASLVTTLHRDDCRKVVLWAAVSNVASDHFSDVAGAYALYRPRYPAALFEYLAGLVPARTAVWDCGAGSGQATEGLIPHFGRVFASDISRRQLASAPGTRSALRLVCSGEWSALAEASVDLITVAQALHWLDLELFYAEVRRVLRPGGVLAAWSYDLAGLGDTALDAELREFYEVTVGEYWPPERRLVEEQYREMSFPFDEDLAPAFSMEADWTLDELLGYVGTWSAVSRFRAAAGSDPVAILAGRLLPLWGAPNYRRRLHWPLALRIGRLHSLGRVARSTGLEDA